MRQIVLDTETTGLEPSQGHRIIEIGCVEIVNRRLTENHYHQYIQPDREIDEGAFEVHGISNEFLADKPRFVDVVEDFMAFINGAELIIHNAPFDVGFINHELAMLDPVWGAVADHCKITDSLDPAWPAHG
jgi:DNA polymerase-3 subunit epsilon